MTAPRRSGDESIYRIPPYYYLHVLDQNLNGEKKGRQDSAKEISYSYLIQYAHHSDTWSFLLCSVIFGSITTCN